MSIGRTFEEAFQKATRMVAPGRTGFGPSGSGETRAELEVLLKEPSPARAQALADAFAIGMTVAEIHDLTKIDNWFLSKLRNINDLRLKTEELAAESASSTKVWSELLGKGDMALLKKSGFSDRQISEYLAASNGAPDEIAVRVHRKALGVLPFVKQIDTLAAEFPAQTNYLYVTYSGSEHDVTFASAAGTGGVVVLGCGAYCIGSSVEFDWCAVSCVRAVRDAGKQSIVINYNPETVSTDYDECDKLYFEELSLERVLDIYELECAEVRSSFLLFVFLYLLFGFSYSFVCTILLSLLFFLSRASSSPSGVRSRTISRCRSSRTARTSSARRRRRSTAARTATSSARCSTRCRSTSPRGRKCRRSPRLASLRSASSTLASYGRRTFSPAPR